MSIFIGVTTFQNLDQSPQILEMYIIIVRCAFSVTGIIAGLLCTFVVVACPKRNLSLITLLISILSTFGALITIATTIFSTDWADQRKSLTKTIFILTSILSFMSAITICICLLNRFRKSDFRHDDPTECVEHASCILAALFIISAFTSIIGFAMGYTVSQQLVGVKILGGGSHSGIFGLLSTTLFILAICINRRLRLVFLSISLGLGILALVASSVSYYTEEMEYSQSLEYIEKNTMLFYKSINLKLMLLTKHTLVLVTSIFNLVFAAPLTVLICCLLKEDLLVTSRVNDESSPVQHELNYAYQFSQLRAPLLQNCMQYSNIESSPTLPIHSTMRQKMIPQGNMTENNFVGSPQYSRAMKPETSNMNSNVQTCDLLKPLWQSSS